MTRARPAVTGRSLLVVWLVAAVGLGVLLLVAGAAEGAMDDPDQARQRPGFLDGFPLPVPAAPVTATIPRPGRPAVVFFTRGDRLDELCAAAASTDLDADLVVAVPTSGDCGPVPVVADPTGRLAAAYQLRAPEGGGPPVGYAVVDDQGHVRYATLDPTVQDNFFEIDAMLGAL